MLPPPKTEVLLSLPLPLFNSLSFTLNIIVSQIKYREIFNRNILKFNRNYKIEHPNAWNQAQILKYVQ